MKKGRNSNVKQYCASPFAVHDGGMNTIMNHTQVKTLEQVHQILGGTMAVALASGQPGCIRVDTVR